MTLETPKKMKYSSITLDNSTMKLYELPGYIQSIYLVEHQNQFMLLDGCCRADIPTVKHFITEVFGRPFSSLTKVIVTHMHPDHAGAAHKLRKLTGCQVVSSNVDGHWYSGIDGRLMHLTDIALTRWVAKRIGQPQKLLWYSAKLKPDIQLNDLDVIPGFEEWRVHFTQGDTDRDISLHHLPSNKIYVADLIVKVRKRFIAPYPVFYPNRYRASLEKIHALNSQSLLLAHGGEVHPTDEEFATLIEHAPKIPVTHWRSIKNKFKKAFS